MLRGAFGGDDEVLDRAASEIGNGI